MRQQEYYHFLSHKDAIDDLKRERIKVSLINELNDPFELLPYLRYKEHEKIKLYQNIHKAVSKKYGLLCFSRTWNEPLLWGHYADTHKGIAIGFEILKDEILEVKYGSESKRIKFELTNNPEQNEKLFLGLAKTKYEKWAYEEEYRILIKLEDCEIDNNKYFIRFDNRLKVKKIVLGCRFDFKKEIKNITKLAKQLHAEIIPTRKGWEDYKIRQCGTKTYCLKN